MAGYSGVSRNFNGMKRRGHNFAPCLNHISVMEEHSEFHLYEAGDDIAGKSCYQF